MAGISSHALKGLNYPENRFKYNGIEQIGDLGLEDYDAKFRELDPQIGRWWQIDPKTEEMEMWSPYASNYDNPIRFNDFLGDEPDQRGSPRPGPAQVTGFAFVIPVVIATDAIIAAGASAGITLVAVQAIDKLKQVDWSKALDGAGAGVSSVTFIPYNLHPGAVNETKQESTTTAPKEMPVPVAGRLDAPANAPTPPNYVFAKGRNGKQAKLRDVGNDPKEGSNVRGWIKQEQNAIARGKRPSIRVPPGKNLAHTRGKEAAKGYGYEESKIQDIDLHRTQHTVENKLKKKP